MQRLSALLAMTLVLGSATGAAADDSVGEILAIGKDALAANERPTVAPALEDGLEEFGRLAGELGLTAWMSLSPPALLFSATEQADAIRMLTALQQARTTLDSRLGSPDDPTVATAFHFTDPAAYDTLIDRLVAMEPYLSSAADRFKNQTGFAVYRPLVCAVLEGELAPRETSRDNILVHQAALLDVYDRFGVQPFWVREGIALDVEVSVTDQLYAFSGQDGFVKKGRPKAWRTELAKAWKRGRDSLIEQVLEYDQAAFDRENAMRALGLARWLGREKPEAFALFLDAIRDDRDRNITHENPYYIASPETQRNLLENALGQDWTTVALASLEKQEKPEKSSRPSTRSTRGKVSAPLVSFYGR